MDWNCKSIRISLYMLTVALVIAIFFMPDYFGFSVFNSQRIILLLIWFMIFRNYERLVDFTKVIYSFRFNWIIITYLLVLLITAVYRMNINTLLNPFFDQIAILYTMIYLFRKELSIKEFLKILIIIMYILCILGIVEYILKGSLFLNFETIKGLTAGLKTRNGQYRVMGPAHHALGYGLFLLISFPLAAFDYSAEEVNPLKRPLLLVLIIINVFLTGSRSTLGLLGAEVIVIFLMSTARLKKVLIIFGGYFLVTGGITIALFFHTSVVQSIMISVANTIDTVFDSSFAEALGTDTSIYELSQDYRKILPKIFTLDWLSPIIGMGYGYQLIWNYNGVSVSSIDNYYVNQYIKVAYSGLLCQCLFYLAMLGTALKGRFMYGSRLSIVTFYSCFFYFINLWWVDALGTLDYVFVLFAMIYVLNENYIRSVRS
ncbi:MAG: hypothetical protein ACRC3H_12025 [Lachnospiraceae bacterium]